MLAISGSYDEVIIIILWIIIEKEELEGHA